MRTTVTLDPDVQALLKKFMRAKDISFKQALNDAVRQGARAPVAKVAPFVQRTFDMGQPLVDLTKANALAGELEDLEMIARMRRQA
jgi:hypothetical protein